MELLAQCSRALYNEDLLDAKKYIKKLESENSILVVPRVHYANKEAWSNAVNKFSSNIKHFIFYNNFKWLFAKEALKTLSEISDYYLSELNILTKQTCHTWCKKKTGALTQLIEVSYRALRSVSDAGYGTYPFTNWRPKEYRHFIWGVIYQFENNYDRHLYGLEHGWVGQIPYYHCTTCNKYIVGIFKGDPLICNYFYTDTEQLCIPCIKKNRKQITRFQALVRGYFLRKQNN